MFRVTVPPRLAARKKQWDVDGKGRSYLFFLRLSLPLNSRPVKS